MPREVRALRRSKVRRIPKARQRRSEITRAEFNQLIDLLNERAELINRLVESQAIQFQRIAQIQAELDLVKRAWTKVQSEG